MEKYQIQSRIIHIFYRNISMWYIAWRFRCLYASYLANVCAARLHSSYILDSNQNSVLGNEKSCGDVMRTSRVRVVDQVLTLRLDKTTVCVGDNAHLIFLLFCFETIRHYDEWIVRLFRESGCTVLKECHEEITYIQWWIKCLRCF